MRTHAARARLPLIAFYSLMVVGSQQVFGQASRATAPVRLEQEMPSGAIQQIGTQRFRHRLLSGQVAYSPDGSIIASAPLRYGPGVGDDDGRGQIVDFWDASSGQLVDRRPGSKVLFSDNGRSMAILGQSSVRVYDWPNPGTQPRAELIRERNDLVEFALSPDGRVVILIYAVPIPRQQDRPEVPIYRWSGRRILAWDTRSDEILWDVARPDDGRSFAGYSWNIHDSESTKPQGVTISPDGSLIAVFFVEPDHLFLLETATGRIVRQLDDRGWRIATWFSEDGQVLYAAREDLPRAYIKDEFGFDRRALELWDVASGELHTQIEIPEPLYDWSAVAPSPDGERLVIGTRLTGAVLGVLHLESNEVQWSRPVLGLPEFSNSNPSLRFAFSPDGSVVAASLDGIVRQWDAATGEELGQSRRDLPDLTRMALAPDGSWIAVAVESVSHTPRHVRRFAVTTGEELGRFEADFAEEIVAMAVSPDGRWLAACDTEGNLRVWDVSTGAVVRDFSFRNNVQSYLYGFSIPSRRQAIAFSPDGRWLVASSAARCWLLAVAENWPEGPQFETGYDMGVLNGGFFLPGRSTFVAAKHRTVRAVDIAGDEPRVLADLNLDRVIYAVAPAPDGAFMVFITGRYNFIDTGQPTVLIRFDAETWEELDRVELPDSARINSVVCLTDRILACGESDGQITVRKLPTGEILTRHSAHRFFDIQLEVSADGRRWASQGRTALIWNLAATAEH